jgi:DDE superfamily endonuclease
LSLFPTILLVCGKVNFTNLSRYSALCEKSYRRNYSQPFSFTHLNAHLIDETTSTSDCVIGSMDCSFIGKSGKKTFGIDWFYNGSASRAEKGLEISVIAVIDVEAHQGYSLSVQQTPAQLDSAPSQQKAKGQSTQLPTRIAQTTVEQARTLLAQLPEQPTAASRMPDSREPTRIDHYLQQLKQTVADLPTRVKYLAVDGFYSKQKFVDGVVGLNLHLIGKLRQDANLRYLYNGAQKHRGAKRKYDGKVDLVDLSRWTPVRQVEPDLNLYTLVVWHVTLKRQIRIAGLVDMRRAGKTSYVLLFSTDVNLEADLILKYYKARFQIEFIFRDAKQFTGLCDAQTRDARRLDFHFNASLTALNLAKYEVQSRQFQSDKPSQPMPFSMSSYKRLAFNDHLLSRFISMLDLNPTLIKSHPNYESLRAYGLIAP